jgi:hypothetical protein
MRIFLISSTTLVWDGAEDGVASCAHLNCHSTGSDGAGGARCLIGSGGGIGADLGGAEWRRKRGCKVRKCIEERGKTFYTSSLLKGKMPYSLASSVGVYFSHAR